MSKFAAREWERRLLAFLGALINAFSFMHRCKLGCITGGDGMVIPDEETAVIRILILRSYPCGT